MVKLEVITREIQDLKKNVVTEFWKIGDRLKVIQEEKLYLEKFTSFEEYVETEIGISARSAYRYISVATEFTLPRVADSNLTLRKWDMLLPLSEEKREKVIDLIQPKGKVSDAEFKKVVKAVKEEGQFDYSVCFRIEAQQHKIISALNELGEELKVYVPTWNTVQGKEVFINYPARLDLEANHKRILALLEGL